jgi:uncharacterized protein
MPWVPRRRYDPRYYYDPYRDRDWVRRRRYDPGSSCLRDACLLETGCCVAESLDGNCLMAGLMLLPTFIAAGVHPSAMRSPDAAARDGSLWTAAGAMVSVIRCYQRDISAHRPAVCRYSPSCSEYAVQAIDEHGALRGALLAVRRLLRCRPGGGRGADPLPA